MKLTQMQLDTILCLKERGEITANQVAAVLDVSLTSVYRVMRILKDKGLVLSVSKSTGCTLIDSFTIWLRCNVLLNVYKLNTTNS